ncbi:hypothetical protein [Actinomadura alba]|nr:hypothetical protein [Actinomadura alba]
MIDDLEGLESVTDINAHAVRIAGVITPNAECGSYRVVFGCCLPR